MPVRRWLPSGRWARVLAALAAVVVLAVAVAAVAVVATRPAPVAARNVRITVTDGPHDNQHVSLDATLFAPAGTGRVPVIMLAHGFGETKDAVRPEAESLAQDGFAVLTWTARGFGASGGQIALNSPDYEVKDVEGLVSWLARQPRVLLDHPGDPRVGIAGTSYGGGISLLAAAYDHRIDAVMAGATWNNLATALFPDAAAGASPTDGVFKKQWASLLFTQSSGKPGGPASTCGRFLPSLCTLYQQAVQSGRPDSQTVATLLKSSPASVESKMTAPTLLVQGENDSLFGLDQADANYQALRRNGAPADMVWFAGGHDGGDQETSRITGLTEAWFQRWLAPHPRPASAGTGQPGFAVSRTLGISPLDDSVELGVAAGQRYPGLDGTRQDLIRLAGREQTVVNPAGGAPASMSSFPGLGAALGGAGGSGGAGAAAGLSALGGTGIGVDMPGQTAAFTSAPLPASVQLTGAPTVRLRVTAPRGATLFAALYDASQQGGATLPYPVVAPVRVRPAPSAQTVTVRLGAMDYDFAAGHRLRLTVTTTDAGYATPAAPDSYKIALAGPGITVPEDPALTVTEGALPWWTWALPAVAVVAALALLVPRRRRADGGFDPDLADVPLDISGLTKRYKDGKLAVDDLAIRVERGQILGLLGPNGAGKTTTLRALMGLLHPNAGTITIFGRRVHAGSPALSRLGSFVEGPGFLPHLSGRANLDLYWRATGRPAGNAHLEEVLEIAGLGSAIDRLVRTYSRGMGQRLAIAQAMLGLPDLLVLDEPMNGLDPPQIREMRDVLLRYAADGQRAVILSSHLLGEVEQTCTHVVVMGRGQRLAAGTVQEIVGAAGGVVVGTPQADRALSVLKDLEGIVAATAHPDGVLVQPGTIPVSDVVAALVRADVPVEKVDRTRRLEDAFLALVETPEAPAGLIPAGAVAGDAANGAER